MENLMIAVCESKKKQRRSERKAPFISGEEMVLISLGFQRPMIAKLLDLSEVGTLVYVSEESDILDAIGTDCGLTFYHDGKVFELASTVARRSRRLIGFEFVNLSSTALGHVRAKIVQMADWVRG